MSQTMDVLIRLLVDPDSTMSSPSSCRKLLRVIFLVALNVFGSSGQLQSRQTSTGSVVTCRQALYTATINETSAIGTLVLTPTATDANGNALVWSIPDTSLQKFTINPSTGAISVGTQLARSFSVGRSALEFTIQAADSVNPSQTCQSTVRINITPVVAPSVPSTGTGSTTNGFTQTSFTFTASNCAIGATVGQVGSGTTTTGFTYSLTSPNTYFTISSTTGLITLLQIPPAGTYSLTATAISSAGVTTSVPVTITTTCNGIGTGIGTGSFPQSSYSFTVSSCLAGSTVGQVFATSTTGLANTYSLTSPNTYFSIQSNTGLITLLQIPPTGTYTVFVSTINPLTGISSSVPVTITVVCNGIGGTGTTGVTFTQSPYTFTLTTCTIGSFVGSVTGFSTTGGILTYSLLTSSPYFTINPTTGLITTIQIPPSSATQTLLVQATSSTGQTGIASVSVLSSCTNTGTGTGLTPTFTNSNYQFTVTSCTPGAFIGQVSAISPNGGTVTYSVNNGNGLFFVDPTSGLITSLSTPTIGTQTFYVQATSSLGGTAIAPVTITTSCNSINGLNNGGIFSGIVSQGTVPIFAQPYYTFTVTSCTAGTSVGQVFASPGLNIFPTIGLSTPILYSIDNGNPYYTINPTTGQITQSAVPVGTSQTFTVRAQTINGYTSSVPVTITSSCSGSQGTATYTFTSSSCTPGSVVGQITSVASTGATPTYSMVGGTNSLFAISPTGQITAVGQQVSGTQTFQVLATTPDGGSATASVTVTSTCTGSSSSNAPLTFGQSAYTFSTSSCTAGSVIGQVAVGSNPTGGTLTYTLQGGNNQFSINPTTGSILAATTLTGSSASFTVTAVSSTGQSGSAAVSVSLNCGSNVPVIGSGGYLPTVGTGYSNYGGSYGPSYGPTYGSNQPAYPGGSGGYNSNYAPAPYANPGYNTVPIGPSYSAPAGPTYGGGPSYGNTGSYGSSGQYGGSGLYGAGTGAYAGGNYLTSRSMPPQFRQPLYSCSLPCSATDVQRACIIKAGPLATNAAQDTITYTLNPSDKFEMDPNTGEIRTIGPLRTAGTYSLTASAADPFGGTTSVPVTLTVTGSC